MRRFWTLGTLLIFGAITVSLGAFAKPALAQYPYGFGQNGNGYGAQDRGRDRNREVQGGQVHWRGDVDDTAIIYIHGRDVRTETVSGKGTNDVDARVLGYLPHFPTRVFFQQWVGRGRVRIIRQPSPDNDFTAAIRIRDPQPGRSHYEFTVNWR